MKKLILPLAFSIASSLVFAVDEVSTTTTTTTSSGTIAEYEPGSTFVIKESSGPVKYRYGKKVTYVGKSGKELSEEQVKERIKVGAPVHVQYTSDGDDRVISRVEIDDD